MSSIIFITRAKKQADGIKIMRENVLTISAFSHMSLLLPDFRNTDCRLKELQYTNSYFFKAKVKYHKADKLTMFI